MTGISPGFLLSVCVRVLLLPGNVFSQHITNKAVGVIAGDNEKDEIEA
jgi:hypothetical protein